MTSVEDDSTVPAFRFKRRKVNHPKRVRVDEDDTPEALVAQPPSTDAASNAPPPTKEAQEEDSMPNLREILRNRKRPRDRLRNIVRKTEASGTELVRTDAPEPGPDRYTSRFVSQTGHVVDKDDKQMTEYVEARLAEKNYRQYGWPIPKHLHSTVAAIAPDLRHASSTQSPQTTREPTTSADSTLHESPEHGHRIAAGMGKLQEVDLGPDAAARSQQAWEQLQGGPAEKESTGKVRLGRDGKPRRQPKRRNSDDIRRDQMVEAVLRESKLEYFDETPLANTRFAGTDEDMVEQFRTEYFESMESRQQRAPAAPPGGKEGPKGPKLGGSRSARAAMRLQEEQAAKKKK